MIKSNPCKLCGSKWHTAMSCPTKPKPTLTSVRKEMKRSALARGKAMKQRGAVTNKWIATRKQWLADNPPNHAGYYTCHICTKPVLASEMELDHVVSRTRAPELRFVMSNLKPSHHTCNSLKGSRDVGELHV